MLSKFLQIVFLSVQVHGESLDHAVGVHIGSEGFKDLSRVLLRQMPAVRDEVLNDTDVRASGIDTKIQGIRYSLDFSDVKVTPSPDRLRVEILIKDARLDVERLKLKKKVLGVDVRTTCDDMTIKVGHRRAVSAVAHYEINMENDQFAVKAHDTKLDLHRDDYDVRGPRRCSGGLGVGDVIKFVVRQILEQGVPAFEKAGAKQLQNSAKDFERLLSGLLRNPLNVELHETRLLWPYPSFVRMNENSFELSLGLRTDPKEGARKAQVASVIATTEKALVSVHPQLLAWMTRGWKKKLDPAADSALATIINPQSLGAIWPDLLNRENTELQTSIALETGVHLVAQDSQWQLHLPDMTFDVRDPDPYFQLQAAVKLPLELRLNDEQKLVMKSHLGAETSITGKWLIAPQLDLFERDVAEALVLALLDFVGLQNQIYVLDLPDLSELGWSYDSIAQREGRLEVRVR